MTGTSGCGADDGTAYGRRLHTTLDSLAALVRDLEPDRYSGPDACRLVELFA